RLWAVTFSEKAAAELKGRIRQRVDGLATSNSPEEVRRIEPDLWESCGGSPPPASHWRRVLRDLVPAQIHTLHGLPAQILPRHSHPHVPTCSNRFSLWNRPWRPAGGIAARRRSASRPPLSNAFERRLRPSSPPPPEISPPRPARCRRSWHCHGSLPGSAIS